MISVTGPPGPGATGSSAGSASGSAAAAVVAAGRSGRGEVGDVVVAMTSSVGGRTAVDVTVARVREASVSTIQVSFDPPPCDELTINEPAVRATLVRPPHVT